MYWTSGGSFASWDCLGSFYIHLESDVPPAYLQMISSSQGPVPKLWLQKSCTNWDGTPRAMGGGKETTGKASQKIK